MKTYVSMLKGQVRQVEQKEQVAGINGLTRSQASGASGRNQLAVPECAHTLASYFVGFFALRVSLRIGFACVRRLSSEAQLLGSL